MKISHNGKSLFTADASGNLKQWSVLTKRLVWDYGEAHAGWIGSMSITSNNLYLFTGGENGILKMWSIEHTKLWKNFDGAHVGHVWS